jgi:ribosomal protein L32
MIFSSLLTSINLNKISINQTKLKNLLKNLNFYTLNHSIKLSRIKKTIDLMSVDLILARDAIKVLFKANMTKKHLQNRKTTARSRPRRPSRQLTISRLSLDSSCLDYSITAKVISDNQSSSARDSFS